MEVLHRNHCDFLEICFPVFTYSEYGVKGKRECKSFILDNTIYIPLLYITVSVDEEEEEEDSDIEIAKKVEDYYPENKFSAR